MGKTGHEENDGMTWVLRLRLGCILWNSIARYILYIVVQLQRS